MGRFGTPFVLPGSDIASGHFLQQYPAAGEMRENDLLISYEDVLMIIELKARSF